MSCRDPFDTTAVSELQQVFLGLQHDYSELQQVYVMKVAHHIMKVANDIGSVGGIRLQLVASSHAHLL